MENNKKIVEKAKKTLNELGYDVKTTHLYEFFSKMSDYNSYSVAKAKGVDFNGVLSKIKNVLNISESKKESDHKVVDDIFEMYKKGDLNDQFFLGYAEKDNKPLFRNFYHNPNALFVGAMGSGKSQALKFTLFSWMLANSHKTQLFIVDTLKGAGDLSIFFQKDEKGKKLIPQAIEALNDLNKCIQIINLVYSEYEERFNLFKKTNSNSFNDYEKNTGKVLNRIVTVFCESHNLLNLLDFKNTYKTPLSPANKLWTLMRIGRAAGIWFYFESQKGTSSDIAPELVANCVNKMIFKVAPTESSYLIGNSEASTIQSDENGRCLTEMGFVKFPYLGNDDEILTKVLRQHVQPLKGDFAFLTPFMINSVLIDNSLKSFYENKKIFDLAKSIASLDDKTVITTLHEKIGHKVEECKEDNLTHIVSVDDKLKIGVLVRAKPNQNSINYKHVVGLKKSMLDHKIRKGIIYTSSSKISGAIYKLSKEENIEIVDNEDLLKFATKIDNNENIDFLLKDVNPEEDFSFESKVKSIKSDEDAIATVSEIHKYLGHEVEELGVNILGVTHIIDISPELKSVVLIKAGDDNLVTLKHVNNTIKSMSVYECHKGIIYTTSQETVENSQLFNKVRKYALENNVEIVDYEDLKRFAKINDIKNIKRSN